jgi:hypothetical protein
MNSRCDKDVRFDSPSLSSSRRALEYNIISRARLCGASSMHGIPFGCSSIGRRIRVDGTDRYKGEAAVNNIVEKKIAERVVKAIMSAKAVQSE